MEPIQFKVEGVFNFSGRNCWMVVVECIASDYQFDYNKPYLLGGVPGKMHGPMNAKDNQGNPRLHIYCFALDKEVDRFKFKEGDAVTLTTTSTQK